MSLSRREIILSAAAGGLLAGAGLSPADAAAGRNPPLSMHEWEAVQKAAQIEGALEWIQEMRADFERRGVGKNMASVLIRVNTLMIGTRPDLISVKDRYRYDTGDGDFVAIHGERLALQWQMVGMGLERPDEITDAQLHNDFMPAMIDIAASEALLELEGRAKRLHADGLRMRLVQPIRAEGMTTTENGQPAQRFMTMYVSAPAPSDT